MLSTVNVSRQNSTPQQLKVNIILKGILTYEDFY